MYSSSSGRQPVHVDTRSRSCAATTPVVHYRLARICGHIAAAAVTSHRVAAQLGRPLVQVPQSSRDDGGKEWGVPFWMDLEAHGVSRPHFPKLAADQQVDVLVVGAGIVGLKLAHYASKLGLRVLVAEGSQIGHQAASARNQGCLQFVVGDYIAAKAEIGDDAIRLERLGMANRARVKSQLAEYAIDCDWLDNGETYFVGKDAADPAGSLAALVADTAARRADGFDVEMLDPAQCDEILGLPSGRSGQYVGAQRFNYSATFHPGKYLFGLARGIGAKPGVSIYEQTRVSEIIEVPEGKVVATAGGHTVSAAYCLIATNALAPQFANGLARSLRAERGQVAVTEPLSVRPAHGCGGAAPPSAHLTGGRSMPPAWWKEIPEPDGRWRLLFGGCRWRQHPRDDSLFPQFADGDPLTGQAPGPAGGPAAHPRPPHPRLEAEGFAPSAGHQHRIDELFALTFPALAAAGVAFQYRWGGLQCFTADDRPLVGAVEPGSRVFTIAGLSGRGNSYSDVATEYLAGVFAGRPSAIATEFGDVFEKYLAIDRESAVWRTGGTGGKKAAGTIKLPNHQIEEPGTGIGLEYWGRDV